MATILDNRDQPITVDLSSYLGGEMLDSNKLFNLSIETAQPALATLAAKIAIQKPPIQQKVIQLRKKSKTKGKRNKLSEAPVSKVSVDKAIEKLLTNKTLTNVGAVMVLISLTKRNNITLRQCATDQVNSLWLQDIDSRSTVFNGFDRVAGIFQPFVAKAQKGLITYHSSPVYNAMREGSKLLVRMGMVKATAEVQFGSTEKSLEGNMKTLRRTVYRFSLTDTGKKMLKNWDDADNFVFSYWNGRV